VVRTKSEDNTCYSVHVLRTGLSIGWPIAFVFACGALYFLANHAAYYPAKFPEGFWDLQSQLGVSDVWVETSDHVRIHGWMLRREDSRWITLFLHGNAGNITHRASRMQEIAAAGSSILAIDYRGYGKSEGWPTEKGLYRDSEAAYVFLIGLGYRADQIILHGESLGTAVAIELASRRPCAALILEAPFSSGSDVAAAILPVAGPILVHSFNSMNKIRWIGGPKLFMQGDRDEVIPPRICRQLFDAAQGRKEMWVIPGAGHNDILETAGAQYGKKLRAFYASLEH
jgi:uncharacterized protein